MLPRASGERFLVLKQLPPFGRVVVRGPVEWTVAGAWEGLFESIEPLYAWIFYFHSLEFLKHNLGDIEGSLYTSACYTQMRLAYPNRMFPAHPIGFPDGEKKGGCPTPGESISSPHRHIKGW